jgi:hypothetical protein
MKYDKHPSVSYIPCEGNDWELRSWYTKIGCLKTFFLISPIIKTYNSRSEQY